MKEHLNQTKKDGKTRCHGLNAVIPADVWNEKVLPYYKNDAPLPCLEKLKKKKMGRPRSPWSTASPRTKRRKSQNIVDMMQGFPDSDLKFVLKAVKKMAQDASVKRSISAIIDDDVTNVMAPSKAVAHYLIDLSSSKWNSSW